MMERDAVDVRGIRDRLQLTQAEFAARFGLSYAAVRGWEGARRRPGVASRTLLRVIAQAPEVVEAAVGV